MPATFYCAFNTKKKLTRVDTGGGAATASEHEDESEYMPSDVEEEQPPRPKPVANLSKPKKKGKKAPAAPAAGSRSKSVLSPPRQSKPSTQTRPPARSLSNIISYNVSPGGEVVVPVAKTTGYRTNSSNTPFASARHALPVKSSAPPGPAAALPESPLPEAATPTRKRRKESPIKEATRKKQDRYDKIVVDTSSPLKQNRKEITTNVARLFPNPPGGSLFMDQAVNDSLSNMGFGEANILRRKASPTDSKYVRKVVSDKLTNLNGATNDRIKYAAPLSTCKPHSRAHILLSFMSPTHTFPPHSLIHSQPSSAGTSGVPIGRTRYFSTLWRTCETRFSWRTIHR